MPNGRTTEDQIKNLWTALGEKQDSTMCEVMHTALQGDMTRLASAIEKLTVKMEEIVTTTWKTKLWIVALVSGSGTVGGGLTALIFKIISG